MCGEETSKWWKCLLLLHKIKDEKKFKFQLCKSFHCDEQWITWGFNLMVLESTQTSMCLFWNSKKEKFFKADTFVEWKLKECFSDMFYLAWVAETLIIYTHVQSVLILRPNTRHCIAWSWRLKWKVVLCIIVPSASPRPSQLFAKVNKRRV